MSKEVQVVSWCDGDHEAQERAVMERIVTVDGGKPVVLDLCERCDKVMGDLLTLMERGAPADGSKPKRQHRKTPGPYQSTGSGGRVRVLAADMPMDCREPGCVDPRTGVAYVAPTRSALGQHVKQKHHKLLSDYDWTA